MICGTVQNSNSQPLIQQAEILFRNSTSHDIILEVSPAISIFSGFYNVNIEPFRKFVLRRSNPTQAPFWPLLKNDTAFLVGGRKTIAPGDYTLIDFDDGMYYDLDSVSKVLGGISYGLWRFEVYFTDISTNSIFLFEEFYLDESDINHGQEPLSGVDIFFTVLRRTGALNDSILFIHSGAGDSVNLYDSRIVNKNIKAWHKIGLYSPIYGQDPIKPGSPNKGYFKTYYTDLTMPIYGTDFGGRKHKNAGQLDMNLTIEHDISTRDSLIEFPTNVVITPGASLTLSANRTLEIRSPSSTGDTAYTNLIAQTGAFLILQSGSKIVVQSPNRLTLENLSNIIMNQNSEIHFKQGTLFCNKGSRLVIRGKIFFEKGMHQIPCDVESPVSIGDSAHIVLDSATLSLPDDFTLHLKGSETALVLNPGSKLLFGENSGIVCDSGARIVANYATFASVDSTKKWNGISLNDLASDTIKNCIY
jgi:hypothetical protein